MKAASFRLPRQLRRAVLVGTIWLANGRTSHAQSTSSTREGQVSDDANAKAGALANKAAAAAAHRDFASAILYLNSAYELTRHPMFLLGLGEAYLRGGRFVEAAKTLYAYLNNPAWSPNEAQRATAARSLDKAEKQVGVVALAITPAQAHVFIDGKRTDPTERTYLVPGEHVLAVELDAYTSRTETIKIEPGQTQQVTVALQKRPPVVPAVAPTPVVASLPEVAPAPPHERSHRSLRTPVLISEVALTTMAAGAFAWLYVRASNQASEEQTLQEQAVRQTGAGGCATPTPVCRDLGDAADRRAIDFRAARIAGVASLALAGGTVGTWLLWRPGDRVALGYHPHQGGGVVRFQASF